MTRNWLKLTETSEKLLSSELYTKAKRTEMRPGKEKDIDNLSKDTKQAA